MTLPDRDALATYGDALQDYGVGVIDATTDRPATGANQAYASIAAMTQTAIRAIVRMTLNGTAAPVLVSHYSVWGNLVGVAPVLARTGAGIDTITWPATVNDAIGSGKPGFSNNPHTVNLLFGWANIATGTTPFFHHVIITSANVAELHLFNSAGSAADPGSATDVVVYVV